MLEETNVLLIIIDKDNKVVTYNKLSKQTIGEQLNEGVFISDVFKKWKRDEATGLTLATFNDKTFHFLQSSIDNVDHYLLIHMENNIVDSLIDENARLKSLNRDLSAAIENSYDGIYITNDQGITLKTNSAIERITGIPKEYYIGKSVDKLMNRGILKASVTHLVRKNRRTASLVQENYEGKPILMTGAPLFNENGELEKVITNIRDLSDLKDLEKELTKARKLNEEYRKKLSLLKENNYLIQGAIVKSEQMKHVYETAERIANVDATVLISGETGVGKDVLANYIYEKSTRSEVGEIIKVNCGAIPAELLESELFGYEAGAFTGANPKGKMGLFEAANNGVLFLDEIGELPLNLQVKLLRVLQEGEIQKVGGVNLKKINIRIITASNRNLKQMISDGEFREDLYYRLNVIPLEIPPLRKRRDDILPLTKFFLKETNEKYNMNKTFSHDLIRNFYSYDWPGNVRELSNLVERLIVTTPHEEINEQDLPFEHPTKSKPLVKSDLDSIPSLKNVVETAERKVLLLAVEKCKSTYAIANLLEISQATVVRRLQKYGIEFN